MTPLREKMILAMQMRGFSPRTHSSYLAGVTGLAKHFGCSPEIINTTQLNHYFEYLVTERQLAPASCLLHLNSIRFLYIQVLKRPSLELDIKLPKRPQKIPELLTLSEVARLLKACENPKHRMALTLCYGCGLRLSELASLKVSDIDGERHLLRVEQGKGAKDRLVPVSGSLLGLLREYWRLYRPGPWLFCGRGDGPMSVATPQRAYRRSKARAGLLKRGGIHALRHAYATHQLEAGLPVHRLQYLLGHRSIQSTLRYVHWVPSMADRGAQFDLIARLDHD